MASWGSSSADESKPKWLTAAEKLNTYATADGWVYNDPNTTADGELLVAVRGLSIAAKLGTANVTSIALTNPGVRLAADNFTLTASYNEVVTVAGAVPYIQLGGTFAGGTGRAAYVSGTGSNNLIFTYVPVSTDNAAAGSVTIPSVITLNGATIVDAEAVNTSLDLLSSENTPSATITAATQISKAITAATQVSNTISGATATDPVVITATGHGHVDGDKFYISSVGGMTELNGNTYVARNSATNTIELYDLDGNSVDGTAFTAYTSGGNARGEVVLTVGASHGFTDDEKIHILSVGGATELNGTTYSVASAGATTIDLLNSNDTAITTYTSGGTATAEVIVTIGTNNYETNDRVHILAVGGATQLNSKTYMVVDGTNSTVDLLGSNTVIIGTYTSGGTMNLDPRPDISAEAIIKA